MGEIALQRDVGAFTDLLRLTDQAAVTAGGSGDSTTVTGQTIDRMFAGKNSDAVMPLSALVGVLFSATLASGDTLSFYLDVQNSADGVNWTDYATFASAVAATGPSGGGTVRGEYNQQVSLTSAQRYIRLLFVPYTSATGTDTATAIGAAIVAGFDRLAAPNS